MGDRNGVPAEQSLFGRNEQGCQLRRIRFPPGLLAKDGKTGVSDKALFAVLKEVDFRDQDGNGGRGCYASIKTLAEQTGYSSDTVKRALFVLTERLGFLTYERMQEGCSHSVERRVCWAAIRAFNDGESAEGQVRGDEGQVRGDEGQVRGDGGQVRGDGKVRCVDAPLNKQQTNKKPTPTEEAGWAAVAEALRSRGLSQGPALISKARSSGASAEDISAGVSYFDEHAARSGWKPAALGWWISNWSQLAQVTDNWPKRKSGGDVLDVSAVVSELRRATDSRLEHLVRSLLVGPNFTGVRQIALEWGQCRSETVLTCLAREMLRQKVPEVSS